MHYLLLLNLYYTIVTIRFRLIKNTGIHLFGNVYLNPNVFLPEASYSGKTKVIVREIISTFGLSSGVAQQISVHVGKKWESAGLKKSLWKTSFVVQCNYILTVKEKKILLSDTKWLNDNIMDATQKLICKALEWLQSHESVLNWQKKGTPFFNINDEHIQLKHNGGKHLLMPFSSNDRVPSGALVLY